MRDQRAQMAQMIGNGLTFKFQFDRLPFHWPPRGISERRTSTNVRPTSTNSKNVAQTIDIGKI